MQWGNPATLGPLGVLDKLLAGFFQGTMPHSAGFNSIDVSQMNTASWLGMDVLMFVGGASAGTAGGIKVTTFAVLFFVIYTEIRGERGEHLRPPTAPMPMPTPASSRLALREYPNSRLS